MLAACTYLRLLRRVFSLREHVQSHLVLVLFLLNVVCVGDDLLRNDLEACLFKNLPLDAGKDVLPKVQVAPWQLIETCRCSMRQIRAFQCGPASEHFRHEDDGAVIDFGHTCASLSLPLPNDDLSLSIRNDSRYLDVWALSSHCDQQLMLVLETAID